MRADEAACRRPVSAASCIDCVPRFGHEPPEELAAGIELFADSYRAELALASAVLVGVGSTADLLAASTGLPRSRYQVLPLGYRRRFGGTAPLPPPSKGAPFRFAYWGSIGRHKGLGVLLDAFRRYTGSSAAPAELHVLGDFASPEFERELRQQAAGLPVTFHGPFVPSQLQAVAPHCGVFPSTCLETFGLVLDECNELGLPCIVSDHGALPERAAGSALRALPGDPVSLAAAMGRISGESGLWQRLCGARPPLPPELDQHVTELERIYAAAAGPLRGATPVIRQRRIEFLQQQRESALGRAIPEGGPR
jgi:glycosyltransferase involved in cell wall biosynthesis